MAYSHHQPYINSVGDIIFHEPPYKHLHIDVPQYGTETVTKTYDPQAIEGDNGYLTPGYADGEITVSETSPVPLHMAPVYLSSGLDLDDVAHQWELKVIQKSHDPKGEKTGTRIDESGTVYTMVIDGDGKTVRVGPHQLKERAANVHGRYKP